MTVYALSFSPLMVSTAFGVRWYMRATEEAERHPVRIVARTPGSIGTPDHAGISVIIAPPLRPLPAPGSPVWRDRLAAKRAAFVAGCKASWEDFLDWLGFPTPARPGGVR